MTLRFGQWTLGLDGGDPPPARSDRRQGLVGRAHAGARPQRAAGLRRHDRGLQGVSRLRPASRPDLEAEIDAGVAWLEAKTGRAFGAGPHPLLVSVRSGAAVSMPGMMDTVLNLGINDVTEAALAAECGDPGLRPQHPPALPRSLFAHRAASSTAPEFERDAIAAPMARGDRRQLRRRSPERRARAAAQGGSRRVRFVELAPRPPLPPASRHSRRSRHGRHRAGDGVRQSRRALGHGRAVLAQPDSTGARRALWRISAARAGRGRRLGQVHARALVRARSPDARSPRRPAARRRRGSSRPGATCRTSNSPSSAASSISFSRAPPSSRRTRRRISRSTSRAKG